MNKSIISGVFGLVFALVAVAAFAPAAEADCSYNGWKNSNGKCSVSWDKPKYNNYYYNSSYNGYESQQAYLQAYIVQLQQLLRQLMAQQDFDYDYDNDNDADVSVSTKSASSIDDDSASLRGTVDFDGEDEATVFFQYGKTQSFGNSTAMIVLEEDEDEEDFTAGVTGLREDTLYFFRAVAEDEDGDRDYGSTLSFRTDDDNDNDDDDDNSDEDEPSVETEDADDITDSAAELSGEIDMNDFENGVVFFAYGEDEDQVEDVADDFESYNDVEEDGDNLQVTLVDGDLDGNDDVAADITGLDEDTEIFYALCVAYEDEDDDEVIACGDTESFTTDVD